MYDLVVSQRTAEEDIEKIADLVNAAEAFDKHKALGDHTWLDLVHGGRRGILGFIARFKNSTRVIGYAQVSKGNENWALEIVIHPAERSEEKGVTQALLDRSIESIAQQGGGHIHVWTPQHRDELTIALSKRGFTAGRKLIQMRRPLPLETELAASYAQTRPFRPGEDDEAWLKVNNFAFANHPEQGGWDLATLAQRKNEPWFDPNGFLLHFIGDELAGFCWTKVHSNVHPYLGEIYVIGVHPKFSGTGLGKAICIAGLNYLAESSVPIAMLYVDANNAPAMAMYDHLGFHLDHIDLAYINDIKAS